MSEHKDITAQPPSSLDAFSFYNPTKILFGKGMNKQIGKEISMRKHTNVLLVAGGGSIKKNGVYEEVTQSLKENGVEWTELWGVQPNPVLSKVYEGIEIVRKSSPAITAILAVGGGSVIDTCKAIAGGIDHPDIWQCFEGLSALTEKIYPLFVVCTVSATGSEMNMGCVVTNNDKKWNLKHQSLFPVATTIDPQAQYSLPWRTTKDGAIDAIVHCVEGILGAEGFEETTIALAESLILTIIQATNKLQHNPSDYTARANLCWAATLGLNGVAQVALNSGDWATHMLEHALSSMYPELSHGTGLAILLPSYIRWVMKHKVTDSSAPSSSQTPSETVVQRRKPHLAVLRRLSRNVFGIKSGDVLEGVDAMERLFQSWGAPTRFSQLEHESKAYKMMLTCSKGKDDTVCEELNEEEAKVLAKRYFAKKYQGSNGKLEENDVVDWVRLASK
ncbi:putative NADH-dependent butanol dehydrogenase a [Monocercomonoides exilis]|uniref:putative NADH-dependent butanol dehydrogenase a n=1 Tax=Monocercomonoides exilis TaxID=2049356 RepID=UPI003559CD6E|nr:putative NADH-dependent butanol dehydrogenase a [Monocercomonoides exilis]|eukprot:MONOS_13471.1-p1 / transcript=MONOS_13471.1 / gene=MONOS_13471 / organism=Monocercomonoides_exilis_PA203 / gene_product=NADH-dependent butanol dehydrogenase a / transcript_product=NADH-dependent butanol dehydrogenase a / location=Mono_scaffold00833:25608-27215(-) / protein_length=446 / sequence_SO=supercontig / SO=protein_coding / is_pseudo=false